MKPLLFAWSVALLLGWGSRPQAWAQAPTRPDTPRAAQIKAQLHQVLSQPEFSGDDTSRSPLARLGKRIGDAISGFFAALGRLLRNVQPRSAPVPGWLSFMPYLFWGIFLVMAIAGVAWALAAVVRAVAGREATERRKPVVTEDLVEAAEPETVPVDTWLEAARRHAANGDFRRAYRAVFLAVLLRLDHAGHIRFERSRTNGEYLRSLRRAPALLEAVSPTTRDFDARWYGGASITESDYERITTQYRDVVDRLERLPQAGAGAAQQA